MKRKRVVCAMSGGVDSSVAAAMLAAAGCEVVGITLEIWPARSPQAMAHQNGCCGLGAVEDARRVAERLGIAHYTLNLRDAFERAVIDPFRAEYHAGRTPNPCVNCNRFIKFDTLLAAARDLGGERLATGHYARIDVSGGRARLRRALDRRKDQSYVLYGIDPAVLHWLSFPVGELGKDAVRARARELGLVTADKPDSQEICFVPDDYRRIVGDAPPARFCDLAGRDLGPAPPITHFTVGQRRGIGLAGPQPYYVVAIRPGQIVVGGRKDLDVSRFDLDDLRWIEPMPDERDLDVMVRAHATGVPARVELTPTGARVHTRLPVQAVTPGQAAVFYDGDVVVGGGRIVRTETSTVLADPHGPEATTRDEKREATAAT